MAFRKGMLISSRPVQLRKAILALQRTQHHEGLTTDTATLRDLGADL